MDIEVYNMYIHLIYLSISISISIYLSIYLSIYRSIYLSLYIYIYIRHINATNIIYITYNNIKRYDKRIGILVVPSRNIWGSRMYQVNLVEDSL